MSFDALTKLILNSFHQLTVPLQVQNIDNGYWNILRVKQNPPIRCYQNLLTVFNASHQCHSDIWNSNNGRMQKRFSWFHHTFILHGSLVVLSPIPAPPTLSSKSVPSGTAEQLWGWGDTVRDSILSGIRHFFLLILYNFKNIAGGGVEAHAPGPPAPRSLPLASI